MIDIIDFSHYDPNTYYVESSGCSEKCYLFESQSSDFGIFKFPKSNDTYEYISEHLASVLAQIVGISCCDVDIGEYNGRIGCFSHWIYKINKSIFNEGIVLLEAFYPDYDANTYRLRTGEIYSIEMIMPCLYTNTIREQFLIMCIFDFFIGNSDRHHSNWAIIHPYGNYDDILSPLYDNGSSLCSYVTDRQVNLCLHNNDSLKSLCDTKSRSAIGLNNQKRPKHSEMAAYIISEYADKYSKLGDVLERIISISSNDIKSIVYEYNNIVPDDRLQLINMFLIYKQSLLKRLIME